MSRKLVIAGNLHSADREYFASQILPRLDGDLIRYVGEAGYHEKRKLLSEARCLLAPITWDEPFGLFMVEAMACGTPVVAFDRGAVPEVVKHGETGFVVNALDEMAAAVEQVHRIDPKLCRQHVVRNFDVPRMVDDYLAAYERILSAPRPPLAIEVPIAPAGLTQWAVPLVAGPAEVPERAEVAKR